MDVIKELTNLDYGVILIGVCIVAASFKIVSEFIIWIVGLLGLETRDMRQKREEHELLIKTSQSLAVLQEKQSEDVRQSIRHDNMIKNELQNLSKMFIDMEIQDIRWNILNFCADLSNGKEFSRECYDYVFKLYDKYEKVLIDNGLTNGLIEQSIAYIREKYHDNLKYGRFSADGIYGTNTHKKLKSAIK